MSLEKLQKIRARRLDKQLSLVQERKSQMLAAEQHLHQARQELEQFHHWRINHQESLFKGLQGQTFGPEAIFEYRNTLESLGQKEEMLHAAIQQSNEQLKRAQEAYANERQVANALAMKNEKTKEIVEIMNKEDAQIALSKENTPEN
ncbi:MAG TPA: YscO family type III secretion system apparatus protein [Thiolinea sp.]|nr:YscO family type III secretion system apparatus protein [Thiolinea sp.]